MKAVTTIVLFCLMGIISCQGQTGNKTTELKKEMNLLDEQTKMFGQIFDLAGMGDNNPIGDAKNYQELIQKIEAPEELKKQLRELYKVYDLSLDPKKKDALKLIVAKMLNNALEKTQNDRQQ